MSDPNLTLYVASYEDADIAELDYQSLNNTLSDDFMIFGAVVMSRDIDGKVTVKEHQDGNAAGGAMIGGGIGLLIGLFSPPLLAASAVGAGIGALMGHFTKKAEEKTIGVNVEDYLPVNSSAVVVLVDNMYLDNVEAALGKSVKSINKAIDSDDAKKLAKAIAQSDSRIEDAIDY